MVAALVSYLVRSNGLPSALSSVLQIVIVIPVEGALSTTLFYLYGCPCLNVKTKGECSRVTHPAREGEGEEGAISAWPAGEARTKLSSRSPALTAVGQELPGVMCRNGRAD